MVILNDYFNMYAGRDRVGDMLSSVATYSHQLNVLLPMFAEYEKFPPLPDHIRGHLNKLGQLRNRLAHEGHIASGLTKIKVSNYICAAPFGLSYLHLLEIRIKQNRTS